MLKQSLLSVPLLAVALATGTGFAQETPKTAEPTKFYKLEFVLKEVEGGKVLNARTYTTTAAGEARETAQIRAGAKVAVSLGQSGPSANQYQYYDVGVNIDAQAIREVQRDVTLSLHVEADISSLPTESGPATPNIAAPTIRHNKWSSTALVPLRKTTMLYSSDDSASKRQMQLELTATPIQ